MMKPEFEQERTEGTERPILFTGEMVRAILEGRKSQTRRVVKFDCLTKGRLESGWEQNFDLATPGDLSWVAALAGKPDKELKREQQLNVPIRGPQEKHCAWEDCAQVRVYYPSGSVGDRLWMRESFYQFGHWEKIEAVRTRTGRQKWKFVAVTSEVRYLENPPAEFRKGRHHQDPFTDAWHKRLGRFMPRKLNRILLEITQVRVERLQEISEEDALAEGIRKHVGDVNDFEIHTFQSGISLATHLSAKDAYRELWESINGKGSWDKNPWVWAISFKRVERCGN